jgi:hypothetical protein
MGARVWHVARANYHKEVAEHLAQSYADWACVTLFYSALHWVHSSLADEPSLPKDERHPRKHTAPAGHANGGRGVNQLVRDLYPTIHVQYISMFEISRRTRYDVDKLGPNTYSLLVRQWTDVSQFCSGLNQGRRTVPTQQP